MRIGILASGTGTILQALQDADLPIVAVIVDRPKRTLPNVEVTPLRGGGAATVGWQF